VHKRLEKRRREGKNLTPHYGRGKNAGGEPEKENHGGGKGGYMVESTTELPQKRGPAQAKMVLAK